MGWYPSSPCRPAPREFEGHVAADRPGLVCWSAGRIDDLRRRVLGDGRSLAMAAHRPGHVAVLARRRTSPARAPQPPGVGDGFATWAHGPSTRAVGWQPTSCDTHRAAEAGD